MYILANRKRQNPKLENRERIWKLAEIVQEILSLRLEKPELGKTLPLNQSSLEWTEVKADCQCATHDGHVFTFHEGCRKFHEVEALMPKTLAQISFSFIQVGSTDYLTGMKVIPVEGESVCLGYSNSGRDIIVDVPYLEGFILAIGARGIHGIQCVLEGGAFGTIVGSFKNTPQTERFAVTPGPVMAIKAGFDVSFPSRIIVLRF